VSQGPFILIFGLSLLAVMVFVSVLTRFWPPLDIWFLGVAFGVFGATIGWNVGRNG
jgi:hypothetical protein